MLSFPLSGLKLRVNHRLFLPDNVTKEKSLFKILVDYIDKMFPVQAVPLNNYDADPAQAMSTFGLWNLSRKAKTSGHYGRGF